MHKDGNFSKGSFLMYSSALSLKSWLKRSRTLEWIHQVLPCPRAYSVSQPSSLLETALRKESSSPGPYVSISVRSTKVKVSDSNSAEHLPPTRLADSSESASSCRRLVDSPSPPALLHLIIPSSLLSPSILLQLSHARPILAMAQALF